MLLADWVARLGTDAGYQLTQTGSSDKTFTIGAPTGLHISATYTDEAPYLKFAASDSSIQDEIDSFVKRAIERVERRDFGDIVWYSSQFHEVQQNLGSSFMAGFLERLGSQARVLGWRRLGRDVLLEFQESSPPQEPALFAPPAVINIHMAIPGPHAGLFSSFIAHGTLEVVASICAFALGRSVTLPPTVFPSDTAAFQNLSQRRTDNNLLTLARKGVSLDIFSQLHSDGGREIFQRERAAFMTFDAAKAQERDLVACILYVVAAECLTTPNAQWRDTKLTKRFIHFFDNLIPGDLDGIVRHSNFENVFGLRRGSRSERSLRRDLLDEIYSYRSGLVHEGLVPNYAGFGIPFDSGAILRRAMFAEFAEAAMLGYLRSPRSSLVGHPVIDAAAAQVSGN
jgi:hypothetical protein